MKHDRLTANPTVVLREESDDWAILFNPDTGESFAVDPVGVFLWKRLDGRHAFESILAELRQKFEEVPEAAREDCIEFLDDLRKRGFAGTGFAPDRS